MNIQRSTNRVFQAEHYSLGKYILTLKPILVNTLDSEETIHQTYHVGFSLINGDELITDDFSLHMYKPVEMKNLVFDSIFSAQECLDQMTDYEIMICLRSIERGLRFLAEDFADSDSKAIREGLEVLTSQFRTDNPLEYLRMATVNLLH
ncbi:MAG: hypothetical protein ACRCXZ_03165 [Patescibacteria group bacterium]